MLRRFVLSSLVVAALILSGHAALTALISRNAELPFPLPALDLDHRRRIDPRITVSRASNADDYSSVAKAFFTVGSNIASAPSFDRTGNQARGIGIFQNRTNLYQNSSGAQTRSVSNGTAYGVWCESSDDAGTVALSGALSGTAACNGRTGFVASTAGSTSATLTPSGTVTFVQMTVSLGYPSAPIKTTNASVTRQTDVLSLATSSFPFNINQGTVAAEFVPYGNTSSYTVFHVDDGSSNNNRFRIVILAGGTVRFEVDSGGSTIAFATTSNTITTGAINKLAVSWGGRTGQISLNGAAAATTVGISTLPTGLTTVHLGSDGTGAAQLNGYKLTDRYWPLMLDSGLLQRLSAL